VRRLLLAVLAAGCAAEPEPRCGLGLALDEDGCALLRAMARPEAPPPSPGNALADDEAAARLGHRLFFDARFSADNDVRCATCHAPERAFADGVPLAVGLGLVPRNSPTALDVAWRRWAFWDGRADSLWSQPLAALEGELEMGTTRLAVAHRIAKSYADPFQALFGPLPPLDDAARFPPAGKPGDPAWQAMAPGDRELVDAIFAGAGKALEAYQRRLVTGPSRFDRFLAGEVALADDEARGAARFVELGCAGCHHGPVLSDDGFHNLGLGGDPGDPRGRARGVELLLASEFSAAGPHHDGALPADFAPAVAPGDLGGFATPPLRNVADTAPYGHDGRFATLGEAIDAHVGGAPDVGVVDPLLPAAPLDPDDRAAIEAFLHTLSGEPAPLPWRDWPSG
jgi:cytochrome c peroxidase